MDVVWLSLMMMMIMMVVVVAVVSNEATMMVLGWYLHVMLILNDVMGGWEK